MAVFPNSSCENFCIWMQATAWLKITAPQNVIIEEVKDAANASTSVTDHVWNEFLRTTGLWWQYYTAYIQQTEPVQGKAVDYSSISTIVGWSSFTIKEIAYTVIGDLVEVIFYISGTSNSTATTFTVPYPTVNGLVRCQSVIKVVNNGVTTAGGGMANAGFNSDVITCYSSQLLVTWTASGTKTIAGSLRYFK